MNGFPFIKSEPSWKGALTICVAGEKDPESCHYESGCIPRWDCQPVYRDRLPPHELSTIYQNPQTVNRLKKILSFHILAQAY